MLADRLQFTSMVVMVQRQFADLRLLGHLQVLGLPWQQTALSDGAFPGRPSLRRAGVAHAAAGAWVGQAGCFKQSAASPTQRSAQGPLHLCQH